MEVSPSRFAAVTGPGRGVNQEEAICFSVNQPGVQIGGVALYLASQQYQQTDDDLFGDLFDDHYQNQDLPVNFSVTLELLSAQDETGDLSKKTQWTILRTVQRNFEFQYCGTNPFAVTFEGSTSIEPGKRYVVCANIQVGYPMFYGQNGRETSECPAGLVFTFSNCPFNMNTTTDAGQIPSILYTRDVVASPSRFSSVSRAASLNANAGTVHALGFSVNKSGVKISGAGVFLGTDGEYNVTMELITIEQQLDQTQKHNWKILRKVEKTVTYNSCNTAPAAIQFEKEALVKKNEAYAFWITIQGPNATFSGQGGKTSVECNDGLTISFVNCPLTQQTNVQTGHIPVILYSRSEPLSYQRALFRLRLPLTRETFTETSNWQDLNRFSFQVKVTKAKDELTVNLKCSSSLTYEGWFVSVGGQVTLLHPSDRRKSVKQEYAVTLRAEQETRALQAVRLAELGDDAFTRAAAASLHVEVRYSSVSASPGYQVEQLDFSEAWRRSDVDFVFDDGRHVHCHRAVLALASPVFEAMLFSNPPREAAAEAIPLPGKTRENFVKLLWFLYPREMPHEFDEETAFDLAELCHEYAIPRLERRAEATLVASVTEVSALRHLALACKCGFQDLKEKALRCAARLEASELEDDDFYFELSGELQTLVKEARLRFTEVGDD